MKIPSRYIGALALVPLIVGCSDQLVNSDQDNESILHPIQLSASYPSATRATDNAFEDGDQMGVYVLDYVNGVPQDISSNNIHSDNVRFEFDGANNIWNGASPVYWTSKDIPADIIGYYPYSQTLTDGSINVSIKRRQDSSGMDNEMGGYEASDFLWAKAQKVIPSEGKVDLTFCHKLAGMRITLKEGSGFSEGEWDQLEKVVIIPNILPSTTIDITSGDVGAASGDQMSIVPRHFNSEWRAVVVPQTVAAGRNVIDISVGNVSYHLVKNENVEYVSGKLTSLTIAVDKRVDDGGYEFSLIDEALVPWIDDVEFRDGIIRNYTAIKVEKRGTLRNVLTKMGLAFSGIKALKISGEIDNDDFDCLRDELTALKSLNLQECVVWNDNRKNMIPKHAFYKKSTLLHFVFPSQLEVIGEGAFFNSGLMGTLVFPDGLKSIGEFYGDAGAEFVEGVFRDCKSLTGELNLPSSVEFIEDGAFCGTNMRGAIKFPDKLKHIGAVAFSDNQFSGELILPDNLEYLGKLAFAYNKFSGNCRIPSKIKVVKSGTFSGSGFDGLLILHEGISEIQESAFMNCGIKGELKLPSTLTRIGEKAFLKTKISSIIFSENLVQIGSGAFAYCKYLNGSVEIPKKVINVNDYMFYGCSLINELILHENIEVLGAAILSECHSLNSIVCKAQQPPLLSACSRPYYFYFDGINELPLVAETFDGVAKDNFSLKVPKNCVDSYRLAKGWREFKRIAENSGFVCRPHSVISLNKQHKQTIVIDSKSEWEVVEKPDWCTLSKLSGDNKAEVLLSINELSHGVSNREGKIVFREKGTEITTECALKQYDYKYNEDECVTLQNATKGIGIDLLFVGDGWDAASIVDGSYLELVEEQMDAFFDVEPYHTYRDYFNVYACICLSQEVGINTPNTWRDTRFQTFYSFEKDALYLEDENVVFDYAVNHSPLTADRMDKSLIILTLNNNEYGSATVLTDKGSAIAICCSSPGTYPMDTRGIIQHEACGHAFGKLAEERIVENKYISDVEKNKISQYQWSGWYQNISLTGKMSDVRWRDLIYDSRYSDAVDIFEGAYGKTRGVYRAEINSCMNYGIPYFSAPARLDIMRRILEYSGEGFTMEKFYDTDSDKWGSTGTTRSAMPDASDAYVNSGMHHPVRIVKSKKY